MVEETEIIKDVEMKITPENYSLKIGSDNIIQNQVHSIFSENPSIAQRKLKDVLKETRVRIGTVLKTDNLSFLFGAGASMDAGGVSLVDIPKTLEHKLILHAEEDKKAGKPSSWLDLFYETISSLTGDEFQCEDRIKKYHDKEIKDIDAIPYNFEDYLSHLFMWSAGMSGSGKSIIIKNENGDNLKIEKKDLDELIIKLKTNLIVILDLPTTKNGNQLNTHRRFIKKVLTRPLNLRRVNLFTLNYDTLLEQAADAEGAVLVDGFIGTLKRIFRPESYDLDFYFPAQTTEGRVHRFDRALHLYKLHGSINWHRCEQYWGNPYGLYASFFNQECNENDVIIYPSPLKYGQALSLPYSELFRRFSNAVVQSKSVLFTIGYGFGDEHVNALIRQAMAIPSFTLIVVDPSPQSTFVKDLKEMNDERIWIIEGWELGTFKAFVKDLMPDLKEEEINTKMMKTYHMLYKNDNGGDFVKDEDHGE